MQKGGMEISLREYISTAFMTVTLTFAIEFPLLSFIFGFVPNFTVSLAFLLGLSLSILICVLLFFFFYVYPSMRVGERRKEISYELPFATVYLATISGGNTPPATMFKVLSEFEQYKEVSREAAKIARDVELFGMDIITAIRNVASKTPSEDLKELLWGINTTISAGGDVSAFLHEKAKGYMDDYRRRLDEYTSTLSTLLEIYLTLIIVGSMFFIAMSALMSVFGLGGLTRGLLLIAQFFTIFLFLPGLSVGFIYVIRGLSPKR